MGCANSKPAEENRNGGLMGADNNSGAISGGPSGPQTVVGEAIRGGLSADSKTGGAGEAKKLDPKDFMCQKLEGAVVIKSPGSINGQQFIIEDCKNCDIYLLDHLDSVNVDACVGCRIFIGPCMGSVFIRECVDCKWVVACQQFRTRDCKNNDVLLYIGAGHPIIESSTQMRFGCFQGSYFSLPAQFASAKLPVWNSEWSDVYDFSKKKNPDGSDGDRNWELLPTNTRLADILKLDVNGLEKEGVTDSAAERTVPVTTGRVGGGGGGAEIAFVAAFQSEFGFDLLAKLNAELQSGAIQLTRTRQSKLSKEQTGQLFAADAGALAVANANGVVIGMEFAGAGCIAAVGKAIAGSAAASSGGGTKLFTGRDAADNRALIEMFFEAMRVKI